MKQFVYIAGSGHSGSTLLDRLLGSHPSISALGEIHRFSLGLHRNEKPFMCDCGNSIIECFFWSEVITNLIERLCISKNDFLKSFQTTNHDYLKFNSGDKYFNVDAKYKFYPNQLDKYLLGLSPDILLPVLEKLGLLKNHLQYARCSHLLFEAVSDVAETNTIVDSTKNPLRMRSLYLTKKRIMKIIYLKRDGRAVCNSRIQRQGVTMKKAAKIWVAENKKIRLILKYINNVNVYNLKYESLCNSPDKEMNKIFDFLELPHFDSRLCDDRHAIGGNPSRFNESKKIVLDEKWQKKLSKQDLYIFDKFAGNEQHRL